MSSKKLSRTKTIIVSIKSSVVTVIVTIAIVRYFDGILAMNGTTVVTVIVTIAVNNGIVIGASNNFPNSRTKHSMNLNLMMRGNSRYYRCFGSRTSQEIRGSHSYDAA